MITLQSPNQISLSGPNQELLSQVSAATEKVAQLRPFSREVEIRLQQSLVPDRIVASLNMEGIVATRRQTLAVMDALRINENVGRGEIEIRNALRADEFVHEAVQNGVLLSEQLLREINRLLLVELRDDAGAFRLGPVQLPGAPFDPPPAGDVPSLTHHLCELFPLGEAAHPVVQAAWLHAQFTMIHPFSDGNGRGGRLLQDWSLMRRGLMPVGIPPSQRDDYYAALENSDKGKWDDLVEIISLLQLSMVSKIEAIVEEQHRRASWIQQLSTAAARRYENTRHKQYLVWRRRIETLGQAFYQATIELDRSSEVIGATFYDYGVLEFRDWEAICRQGQIDKSWLFSILFFAEGRPFYKTISYLKRHHPLPRVDPFPPPRDAVALYFTGTEAPAGPRPNFLSYEDPHIRLREVLFHEDRQFVYRQLEPRADWSFDEVNGTARIVEDFFLDVFNRKAGLGA